MWRSYHGGGVSGSSETTALGDEADRDAWLHPISITMLYVRVLALAAALSTANAAALHQHNDRPALSSVLALRGGGPVSAVATVKSPKETYFGMA